MTGPRTSHSQYGTRSELKSVLARFRNALIGVGLMSGMINVLYLTGSFFMLQVYDRVLPSRSIPTLVGLLVFALVLYAFLGILDVFRGRVLVRIGTALDEALTKRVFDLVIHLPLKIRTLDGLQPVRDLDQVRSFLGSMGPAALFDLPWMPLYLAICFAFHFWIGMAVTIGALLLIVVTFLTETLIRTPTRISTLAGAARNKLAEGGRRNSEVLRAMGMGDRFGVHWYETNQRYLRAQQRASDVTGGFAAFSKVLRMALQSAVLGLGAYLVIEQQATAGVIIASSILTSRALAPVELAVATWRGFVGARQSWKRLADLFAAVPAIEPPMQLDRPQSRLAIEAVSVAPPGGANVVVQDVSFELRAGDGLAIIGPSGSGKSSLARLLVGVWTPLRGKIRLDGAALDQWSARDLGEHIGYLPQDVELFAGTVGENIARFDADPDPNAIRAAAQAANVHDLVLRLPNGYDTQIGEGGAVLSVGQRQRVALARALYRNPFLVVLDEPNSNLDAEGEQALMQAIVEARRRGAIVVIVTHRATALSSVNLILMLTNGRLHAFGSKDEVLSKVLRAPPPAELAPDRGDSVKIIEGASP